MFSKNCFHGAHGRRVRRGDEHRMGVNICRCHVVDKSF